ncbi:hypothetical protein [uncultured Nostoc sp.]|uniref:hypothetical protein n=1 Tax=uncultured Nostoc sp. TaxID=340711 RepID=UPI0035CA27FE
MRDSDPPLIVDHQIYDLVGVLNPFIHPLFRSEFNSEFWRLTPEFCFNKERPDIVPEIDR